MIHSIATRFLLLLAILVTCTEVFSPIIAADDAMTTTTTTTKAHALHRHVASVEDSSPDDTETETVREYENSRGNAPQDVSNDDEQLSMSSQQSSTRPPPNVLLVIVDDLPHVISPMLEPGHPLMNVHGENGSVVPFTPNMNRLAGESVTFDSTFCQECVCNPSRASFLSSRYPTQLQLFDKSRATALPDWQKNRVPIITRLMKRLGYQILGVGKIFHKESPWLFNEYVGFPSQNKICSNKNYCTPRPGRLVDLHVAQTAVRLARTASRTKPWFLAVGFHRPHVKFSGSAEAYRQTDPAVFNATADMPDAARLVARPDNNGIPVFAPTASAKSKDTITTAVRTIAQKQAMAGSIQWADMCLGMVMQGLETLGLWNDQLMVVLVSDNGQLTGEHSINGKSVLYEPSRKVPMMVRDPRYKNAWGVRSGALAELVDVIPTIADGVGNAALPYSYRKPAAGLSLGPIMSHIAAVRGAPTNHAILSLPLPRYNESLRLGSITEEFRCTTRRGALGNAGRAGKPFSGDWYACGVEAHAGNNPRNLADMIGLSFRTAKYAYIEWRSTSKSGKLSGDPLGTTSVNFDSGSLWGREFYDYTQDDGLTAVDGIRLEHFNLAPCPSSCFPRFFPAKRVEVSAEPNYPWSLARDDPQAQYGIPDPESVPPQYLNVVRSLSLALRALHRDYQPLCNNRGYPDVNKPGKCYDCVSGYSGEQCEVSHLSSFAV